MRKLSPYALLLLLFATPAAWAGEFAWQQLYYGGGFGGTALPQESETTRSTVQLFMGYPFTTPAKWGRAAPSRYSLELGYVDVSDSTNSDGFWVTPVVNRYLSGDFDLIARAGVELGEKRGLTGAIGLDYKIEPAITTRLEVVGRPVASALFLSVVYRP